METDTCDFGCECDSPSQVDPVELSREELVRLLEEKIQRVKRMKGQLVPTAD